MPCPSPNRGGRAFLLRSKGFSRSRRAIAYRFVHFADTATAFSTALDVLHIYS
jgi:hypothetical protein